MIGFVFFGSMFWLLFLGYAEIHYRLGWFKGRLFKKEPEILFDLPSRGKFGDAVPLFLVVKDAHLFPIRIEKIRVQIFQDRNTFQANHEVSVNLSVDKEFFSKIFYLPGQLFPEAGAYRVIARAEVQIDGRWKQIRQDNYPGIETPPFQVYIAEEDLPTLPGWHWGDLHVHSHYTSDEIEFGPSLEMIQEGARSVGLSFVGITDHSYDFPVDHSKGKSQRWEAYQKEIEQVNRQPSGVILLPGEEVSVGNSRNQNVHFLVIGHSEFIPGMGDGALRPFNNQPTLSLREVIGNHRSPDVFFAAAHALTRPPLSQRIILNRGYYRMEDLYTDGLDAWQFWNGEDWKLEQVLPIWVEALLQGKKVSLIAGTDAHGNFNLNRFIATPLWKIGMNYQHIFGSMRTAVQVNEAPTRQSILRALKNHQSLVSNGPIGAITRLPGNGATEPVRVEIEARSSSEFGELTQVTLLIGEKGSKIEHSFPMKITNRMHLKERFTVPEGISPRYFRLEIYSRKEENSFFCLNNPSWEI